MRRQLLRHGFGADHGFRWRGGDISRLEGLSDAVFAFFAFAVCFAILFWVWYDHYRFSGPPRPTPSSPGRCRC
jgi:hypothetical protein